MLIEKLLALRGYCAPAGDDGAAAGAGAPDKEEDRGDTLPEQDDKDDERRLGDDDDDDEADEDGKKGEEGKDKPPKKGRIPLSRHEAILARERERREAVEAQLKQFKGAEDVQRTGAELSQIEDKVVELEKEYGRLLTDGEHEKAAEKMREIRRLEREATRAEAERNLAVATAQAREATRYDVAVERIEEAYPELNPDHEKFDKEVLSDVVELKEAYQLKGLTPTAAMQKAVRLILGSESSRQTSAITVKPRVDEDEVARAVARDTRAERKGTAVDKALSTRQPPSLSGRGLDSDKAGRKDTPSDVMKMNQKQFAEFAKDEAALARARGDEIEA